MLAEAAGVKKIVIACGHTDLHKSIDGLAQLIGTEYDPKPFEKDALFLFCGRKKDRIRGLLREGTGFLLLYKRLEAGSFSRLGTPEEAAAPHMINAEALESLLPWAEELPEIHRKPRS